MKQKFYWILGGVTGLMIALFALQTIASERIEVVELHTLDTEGETVITRLWIVDYKGHPYLRAGYEESGWYTRIKANETIKLTREGETHIYRAEAFPEVKARIRALMQEKYTWGDSYIGMIFGRDDSIPVKLTKM